MKRPNAARADPWAFFMFRYEAIIALVWITFIAVSLAWNIQQVRDRTINIALNEARMSFRLWATSHGGVYVNIDARTQPDPSPAHIPERDITTPSGPSDPSEKKLTMMNPSYMMRQIIDEYSSQYGIKVHLASLRPLWKGNVPDQWEGRALKALEMADEGPGEFYEVADIKGEPFLRFMRPMVGQEGCLKCHGVLGYKEGDVIGGIGVSVPMSPLQAFADKDIFALCLSHGLIWILGMAGIVIGGQWVKRGLAERRKAEYLIKDILDNMGEAIIVIDNDYKVISAKRAVCEQTGLPVEDILRKHCHQITHHSERPCFDIGEECPIRATFITGESHSVTHVHYASDGKESYVEIRSYPIKDSSGRVRSAIETITDVTERRKFEEHLRQAQKMEAIGALTGGISHDFNNILTTILGYGEFIRDELEENSPLKKYIEMIISSGTKAARLTQSLLAFSRKQVIRPEPLKVNSVVGKMETMMSRLIGENIEISAELSDDPLVVMADSVQLEQVMMNLATNARDAMPEGGTILVKTETMEIDSMFIESHGFGKPGKYALISLSDNGTGMKENVLQHIFEPFFTTKEVGKGTGLGLSVVYGIIKQHEGFINVYSEPGIGTTYKILLPLLDAEVVEKPEQEIEKARKGTETLLIAEDDEAVRSMIVKTLTDFGYKVIEATDGEDAMEKFRENIDDVQLLMLDMIMPKKNGTEVLKAARQLRPGIKAMLISGYPADFIDKKIVPEEGLHLVNKPIFPTALLKKIREVFDE